MGGRKAGTPNKATSMKAIGQRLATEDGELLYSAIRAALAAHGQPISMAAVRLCLEYGIGLPAKMAPDGGNHQLICSRSTRSARTRTPWTG